MPGCRDRLLLRLRILEVMVVIAPKKFLSVGEDGVEGEVGDAGEDIDWVWKYCPCADWQGGVYSVGDIEELVCDCTRVEADDSRVKIVVGSG